MLKYRTRELLAIPKHGTGIITEHSNFCCVCALIGEEQGKIGINAVFLLCNTKRPIFFCTPFHAVKLERSLGRFKSQLLLHGAHFLKRIAVAFLDHLTDLLGGRRHAGGALAHVNTAGLQAFSFEVVRLVGALAYRNAYHLVFLDREAHEHCDIRHNGVTDAVGDTGIFLIHISQSNSVAVVVDPDVHNASVRIGEGNYFFIDILGKLRFEFDVLGLNIHRSASS